MNKAIYIFHNPPANLNLDIIYNGNKVGSIAEYKFLKENQPKLSLHGHIQESHEVSGKWSSHLGNTLCIQPGQYPQHVDSLIYVLIDLDTMKIERKIAKK